MSEQSKSKAPHIHPLLLRPVIPVMKSLRHWKDVFDQPERTLGELEGLLFSGLKEMWEISHFSTDLTFSPSDMVCFYFDLADGCGEADRFLCHPNESSLRRGRGLAFWERRERVARKAFDMLLADLFTNQNKGGSVPSWDWVLDNETATRKVLWFFDPHQRGGFNLPIRPSYGFTWLSDHKKEVLFRFLRVMCAKMLAGLAFREDPSAGLDVEDRAWFSEDAYHEFLPSLLRILCATGATDVLLDHYGNRCPEDHLAIIRHIALAESWKTSKEYDSLDEAAAKGHSQVVRAYLLLDARARYDKRVAAERAREEEAGQLRARLAQIENK